MEDTREKDLRRLIQQSFTGAAANLVLEAYDCAVERLSDAFADQTRAASILLSQHADHVVVTSALLAPLRRYGLIEASEIQSRFGEEPATLVEKVFAEDTLRTDTETHRKEDLRRFLTSISGSLRAVILRIGLRLAELERETDHIQDAPHDVARETMELYVPLADRMGMGAIRTQLEDTCFQILEPAIYEELARNVEPIRSGDKVCLALLKHDVKSLLQENGVDGEVYGRTKGLYSLYGKMRRLKCPLQDIMDRIGLRIIASSVEECRAVLDLLHTRFRPVPGTFADYIRHPKENGYQSLHTCVYPVPDISQKPVEFQIRTEAMHREAEFGVAAHWLYKSEENAAVNGDERLHWLRSLMPQRENAADYTEFIQQLYHQVFGDEAERVPLSEDKTLETRGLQVNGMFSAPKSDSG